MKSASGYGDVEQALKQGRDLLTRAPALAAEQAREILKIAPGSAAAYALQGEGLSMGGATDEAEAAFAKAVRLDPGLVDAWRHLASQRLVLGDGAGASQALAGELLASTRNPRLQAAARALLANDIPVAERLLKAHLKEDDADVAALRMLAEVAGRLGRYDDACILLEHALGVAPHFTAARFNLALAHYRQHKPMLAIAQLDQLLDEEPGQPLYVNLKAAALTLVGDLEPAITLFEQVLAARPAQPKIWLSYGHALKTLGRQSDAVAAYRHALELEPGLGEAWCSLANLKTVRLADGDVSAMQAALAAPGLSTDDRFHLNYALGKALEERGLNAQAFQAYAEGARARRQSLAFTPVTRRVSRSVEMFTQETFAQRRDMGCPTADPIFILGMPRAGSTLIEQILASHSAIEGTQELPDIQALARLHAGLEREDYPAGVLEMDGDALARVGQDYLARTLPQRRLGRAHFIDKMPNNWLHTPFLHLILPRAKIIDARRHPLACCFSNFKQHFARGQAFTYDLSELGQYYADYVTLMDHIDTVLPGRVLRVHYEAVVEDLESEVRRIMHYLELPFEPAQLDFHQTQRAVRTASSEQVRQPLFRHGVDQWRNFEPWLDPLKSALGPVLDAYPFEA